MGDVRASLVELGRQRACARASLDALRPRLEIAMRSAHAAGVPIAEIARLARVTRRTVYLMLRPDRE